MAVIRTFLCILGSASIAGCAAPAPKPSLDDYAYHDFAYSVVGTHKCVQSGQISSSIGAAGLRHDQAELSKWSVDRERLRANFTELDASLTPTTEWCSSKVLEIAQQPKETQIYSQPTAQNSIDWAGIFASLSTPGQRNYVTNPITASPARQPIQSNTNGSEQYQTIMVNTPNGVVYKRCKVLNGQVVACF